MELHPYKIQMTHPLEEKDFEKRLNFAIEMMERFTSLNNIIFSDEAHLHLDGVANKQNFNNWSDENPN